MSDLVVVLVEPQIEGNVGAVARSMSNFGLSDLVLVRPCPLGDEAFRRAKHGRDVLGQAQRVARLEEALRGIDLSVGTTGIPSAKERAFHRRTVEPGDLSEKIERTEGRTAVLFGRENYGLYNEELDRVDLLVHIPCDSAHSVMNLSHAAAILFYELGKRRTSESAWVPDAADESERETLLRALDELLVASRYPRHKRRRTRVMFRRLIGRATPSRAEFHALMGVFRRGSKAIRRLSGSRGPGSSS